MMAIVIAVVIAALIVPRIEARKARRDQQERLLRSLINTWQLPANPEYQGALALIPIDFKGNKRVLDLRTEYLALVNSPAPDDDAAAAEHFNRAVDKQSDLIAGIAQAIGIDLTSEALRTGAYVSKGYVDREQLLLAAMGSWPRIAIALERNNQMFAHSLGILPGQQEPQSDEDEGKPSVEN
jgi:hypothetical protein